MPGGQPFPLAGGSVRSKAISRNAFGWKALLLEQLAKKPPCRLGVSSRLDKEIEDFALVIDGPPKPMAPSADFDDHLVQMPSRTGLWTALAQIAGDKAAEFQEPAPNRLVRGVDATFGKQFLNVPEGELEPGIEPDGMQDQHGWKAVALERDRLHWPSLRRVSQRPG